MGQLTIFETLLKSLPYPATDGHDAFARATDPMTSQAAAASVDCTKLEGEVLAVVKSFGVAGCIAEEVLRKFPNGSQSITPRFRPRLRKGLIIEAGELRRASSGRNQRVVRAT